MIIGQSQRSVIPSFRFPDGHLRDLRLLGVDGNGEFPAGAPVVGFVGVKYQIRFNLHGGFGIVGQSRSPLVGAVPGIDGVVLVDTGGNNLEVAAVVD